MGKVVFDRERLQGIKRLLMDFKKKTSARATVLFHESGQPVAYSLSGKVPVEAMTALISGAFAASKEFFRLMGEGDVDSIVLEGKEHSLYAVRLKESFLAFVLFSQRETRLGIVKLHVSQLKKALSERLEGVEEPPEAPAGDLELEEMLEEREDGRIEEIIDMLKKEIEGGLKD